MYVCMYVCICICIYTHKTISIYIYSYAYLAGDPESEAARPHVTTPGKGGMSFGCFVGEADAKLWESQSCRV